MVEKKNSDLFPVLLLPNKNNSLSYKNEWGTHMGCYDIQNDDKTTEQQHILQTLLSISLRCYPKEMQVDALRDFLPMMLIHALAG